MPGLLHLFISTSSKDLLNDSFYRDMGNELVMMLEQEFNELYEQTDVVKIETKIRNIKFLGELTKF